MKKKFLLFSLILFILSQIIIFIILRQKNHIIKRIILITVDTLRADHLSSYGYPRKTSECIDRFARNGTIFHNALSPISTTSPAHASIFTSLYPLQHNVMKNGHILQDKYTTMAEILKSAEFKTAGFASTYLHFKVANMHQGFDFYDEPNPEDTPYYRPAHETTDAAINWINNQDPSQKTFMWIHYFDPHGPYRTHEFFNSASKDEEDFLANYLMEKQHISTTIHDNDPAKMYAVITNYDAEIHFADTQISRFLDNMLNNGFYDNTLWIITADHGEGLGNHDWMEHGKNIYNEQLRVPLIMFFSSGRYKNKSIKKIVELTDILPTLIQIIGGKAAESFKKIPNAQGTSLLPLLNDVPDSFPDKYAFAQRMMYSAESTDKLKFPDRYEPGEKYAFQSKDFKYIYRTAGNDEFFNLKKDPYETINIHGDPEFRYISRKMKDLLIDKIEQLKKGTFIEPEIADSQVIEKLRSLGYIQ
ncbi:sulfatase [Elusimicrobiota bacterium]